jgi:uncharacterized repeat protein (TIGR03803 family)
MTDGAYPYAGLVLATNGYLYGTTEYGGANCAPTGCGTVFKLSPDGTFTTLHSFCSESGCRDGEHPYAGLVQAFNEDGYGTTTGGGATGHGTVFRITGTGTLTTLYSFTGGTDGGDPVAGLVQATNGYFYGTTEYGGSGANCASTGGCGTVFKIAPSGTLTTLYSFCAQGGCPDGESPGADLIQATDGNLYGTTNLGGADGVGTIFRITPGGTLTTLYSFTGADENPVAGLVQATNGEFYGTASVGGASGDGAIFSLSVGLGPFVTTLPTSGDVGSPITILGSDLTGATSVGFNGTPAVFDVVSATEITTTVPSGATTGTVQVVTPSGTLSSNVPFRVL